MKTFYLLVVAALISFTACRTPEGEPGPAGESSLNQQGSVTATITYTDDNGDDANTSFNYQYYESVEDNKFYYYDEDGEYYGIEFARRDLKDENNYFYLITQGDANAGVESDPDYSYINFSFLTVINNEVHEFENNNIEITNVKIDPSTGRVTFDFSGTVYDNGNEATITGKVNVVLNRSRQYIGIPA